MARNYRPGPWWLRRADGDYVWKLDDERAYYVLFVGGGHNMTARREGWVMVAPDGTEHGLHRYRKGAMEAAEFHFLRAQKENA